MKNQKGFSQVVIIAVVAVLIAVGVFMAIKKGSQQVTTQTQRPEVSAIQNSSDFDVIIADLDNTDVDGIGAELNQMNADASTF